MHKFRYLSVAAAFLAWSIGGTSLALATPVASVDAFAGDGQSATVGTAFAIALKAKVFGPCGELLSGLTVTFTAPSSGASATFPNGASAVTNAQGIATVNVSANGTAGAYQVTATTAGIPGLFSLTNTQSAQPVPTTLSVAAASGSYNGVTSVSATLSDAGTPISGRTIAFTLNGTAVASAVTNSAGIASVSNASLSGISVGGYVAGVGGSFAGDATYESSTGSAGLTVSATVPGAPTIGSATAGNANASVTFSAPVNNGGSSITGYTVTSNPAGITGAGSASPITVSGLTNGTAYTFTVTATNGIGAGSASAASNNVTPATVPGAPTIGSATAGNANASVTFSAPANNGGSTITGYTATSNPGGIIGAGSASPITVSGLTNGTAYTFTVTATNGIGAGSASAASNSVTPATVPGAPTIGSATAGNASASITFSAPAGNGGSTITGYTATSNPGGITGTGSASPITVSGLTNGTAYTFTVTATNGIGAGSASAVSNNVTPVPVPGAPTIGLATRGNGSASVMFTAPGNSGGAAITSYTVTSSPSGLTATGSASPITVSGLTNGTAYTFTVTATNSVGTGTASAASGSVTPATSPDAPGIGTATRGNSSVTVSFTAPATDGGATITIYTVTSNPGGFTGTGSSSPITVTGLANGTAYTFTVTATNSAGTGPASAASNSVTAATVPGAPTIGIATGADGTARVPFSAPASNGGTAITSYTVTAHPGGITATATSSPITVVGLANGTAYTFTVTASNSAGAGAASASSNSVILVGAPDAPTGVSAAAGNASATVSFIAPKHNGGAPIQIYTVTSSPGNLTGAGAFSPITVSGLSNGTIYTFTVTASNKASSGNPSTASNAVTPTSQATVPGAPSIGSVTPGNASAIVSFTAPANNGGSPISSYTVTSNPGSIASIGLSSPTTVVGLTNGVAYTFTVSATNSAGTGASSAASSSITPSAGVPGAPREVQATSGNGQATVTFTAPASSGNSAITKYTATANPGGLTGSGSASPITVFGLKNGSAYTFTVTASNATGTGSASDPSNAVTLDIPLSLDLQSTFPHGMVGTEYPLQILAATGGAAPYKFVIASGLPDGLTFSAPQLGGIPDQVGDFSFTITVTDAAGHSASSVRSISIVPAQADLLISESTARFSLMAGSGTLPTPASITIRSSVIQQLLKYSVTVSPAVEWLDVTTGTSTPGSLTLALNQAALALPVGSDSTAVHVTCIAPSPCAGIAQTIAVTLLVSAPAPQLSLTAGLVSFSSRDSSTGSQSETVGVQNVGVGSITVTSASAADSWLSVSNIPKTLGSGAAVPLTITANPARLGPGYYRSTVTINSSAGAATLPVTLLISNTVTITLGPSGTQYYLPAGGVLGSSTGAFGVTVTGGAAAAYNAAVLPGAKWLAVTSAAGTATAAAPGSVRYSLDPISIASLSPGIYYGAIRVISTDALDSPQDFLLVLNVTAASQPVAPELSTAGLVFITNSNGDASGAAAPQTVQVFASSASPLVYQASAATEDGETWLAVGPSTGAASAGSPGASSISVHTKDLRPGVYRGGVSYAFSSASVRTVNVTLIIASDGSSSAPLANIQTESAPNAASKCVPVNLVGTQTGLVNNFARPVGLPVPLLVYLVNDCGTPISDGQVAAVFSSGDPLLRFTPVSTIAGLYTATWTPRSVSAQVTVTSSASVAGLPTGSNSVTGEVTPSKVPVLGAGLTLNAFNPLLGGALAPGTIVQIYGTNLAASAAQAQNNPLPATLGGTSVTIGGLVAPLFYVSPGQINAQVPWELRAGYQYQISIRAASGDSTPDSVQIAAVSPGVAALAAGGAIATHANGSLITTALPARPGETVVLYSTGLGATDPAIATGAASPASPLARAHSTPVVSVNGAKAMVSFAGMTPYSIGLSQINFQIPLGSPDGDLLVAVSQDGVRANAVTLSVHQ